MSFVFLFFLASSPLGHSSGKCDGLATLMVQATPIAAITALDNDSSCIKNIYIEY
jgi:hypothetical protein